ncbi:MAG: TfoX/Sxy family protein [Chloroflexi bacterium]|nr:TfoX/Sxy family protein [Chloroflexota bacterium]
MPYNLDLEDRIDRLASRFGELTKKKMFGGVGYMLGGNMCFGIHKDYLVLRTSPEQAEKLLKKEYFEPFDITGRPMKGWLMVSPDAAETDEQLLDLLKLGADYARTLPKR